MTRAWPRAATSAQRSPRPLLVQLRVEIVEKGHRGHPALLAEDRERGQGEGEEQASRLAGGGLGRRLPPVYGEGDGIAVGSEQACAPPAISCAWPCGRALRQSASRWDGFRGPGPRRAGACRTPRPRGGNHGGSARAQALHVGGAPALRSAAPSVDETLGPRRKVARAAARVSVPLQPHALEVADGLGVGRPEGASLRGPGTRRRSRMLPRTTRSRSVEYTIASSRPR